MIDYSGLPEHMRGAFQRYIEKGIPPGSFATAVLSNDLFGAFSRADETNRERMFDTVSFLYNNAPGGCWGSLSSVKDWIKRGGLNGQDQEAM